MSDLTRAELVPLAGLKPWSENPRVIEPGRLEQLKRSLEADAGMLEVRPLVALPDGTVIMGNQRLAAAQALGWERLPVAVVDLDEETARSWAIRDNQSYGEWEPEDLSVILRDMRERDTDLEVLGFREDELDELLAERNRNPGEPLPEREPRLNPQPPTSRASLTELVLLIPKARKPAFDGQIAQLRDSWGTTSTADTVLRAIEACVARET